MLTSLDLILHLTDSSEGGGETPVEGKEITLESDRGSVDIIDQPQGFTDGSGENTASVETRDQDSVSTIKASDRGIRTEQPAMITWLPAKFESTFKVTCYLTASEGEFGGGTMSADRVNWCTGVTPPANQYLRKFIRNIKVNGSGIGLGGEIIQHTGGNSGCYYLSNCPLTASGSCAQVGTSLAVDNSVIPRGATVLIDGVGTRIADDVGGGVGGAHIDVYGGVGESACAPLPFTSDGTVTFVSY